MNTTAYAVMAIKPDNNEALGIGIFSDPTPNITPNIPVVVSAEIASTYQKASDNLDNRLRADPYLSKLYKGLREPPKDTPIPDVDYEFFSDRRVRRAEIALNTPRETILVSRPCPDGVVIISYDFEACRLQVSLTVEQFEAFRQAVNRINEPAPDARELYW